MQGAPPVRYVSVSELYSTDEVELLLDEIRDLEPTSCRGEDVQDFEIAGSGAVEAAGGAGSPAGTERTEHSWDSHAHYSRAPPPVPQPLAPVYCRPGIFLTGSGLTSACACLCGFSAVACVWAAAGLRGRLPLAARVRLLQLAALSAGLLHAALLLARLSRLQQLLPLPWRSLTCFICTWSVLSLSAGGGATLHALLGSPLYAAAPPHRLNTLIAAASLALIGAFFSILCIIFTVLPGRRSPARGQPPAVRSPSALYRALPSTSRDHAL